MRTWGLMLNFIPFGWNSVLKYQHLGVDLLQNEKVDKSLQLLKTERKIVLVLVLLNTAGPGLFSTSFT